MCHQREELIFDTNRDLQMIDHIIIIITHLNDIKYPQIVR